MTNPRFYMNHPLASGNTFELPENAAAHATRVLRLNVGDGIIVFNGDGFDYECILTLVKKNSVTAVVLTATKVTTESPLKITLLQAISSGDRMDFTIQKAVEMGVTSIQPITSQRSLVKLSAERTEKRILHWQHIATSACEQSGRAIVPKISNPVSLQHWLGEHSTRIATRILLNPIGALHLSDMAALNAEIQSTEILLLIGAEGGLSPLEIELALKHGFQSVVLGARILRTETAALAAIAAIQTLWGDY